MEPEGPVLWSQEAATDNDAPDVVGFLVIFLQDLYSTYLLHGTESFLRSYLVLQLVKNFSAFLEPEGSSP